MSNYTKEQRRDRYDAFYRSLNWCTADPATDQVAEPDACGPSLDTIFAARRPNEAHYMEEFDPLWSPDERWRARADARLDFN